MSLDDSNFKENPRPKYLVYPAGELPLIDMSEYARHPDKRYKFADNLLNSLSNLNSLKRKVSFLREKDITNTARRQILQTLYPKIHSVVEGRTTNNLEAQLVRDFKDRYEVHRDIQEEERMQTEWMAPAIFIGIGLAVAFIYHYLR